jgi:hypothetical protein
MEHLDLCAASLKQSMDRHFKQMERDFPDADLTDCRNAVNRFLQFNVGNPGDFVKLSQSQTSLMALLNRTRNTLRRNETQSTGLT